MPATAQHPVLVLWDASPADMALLCDFMYFGQVNVQQDRLPSFLALASRLEVKGLTQTPEEPREGQGGKVAGGKEGVKERVKERVRLRRDERG